MEKNTKKINFVSLKLVKHEIEVKENYYNSINEPKVAAEIIKDFIGDRDRECMVVLSLNIQNVINSISIVSIGSLNQSLVHPREVFKIAIMSNAASIIVGHNHPSGNLVPSKQDKLITHRLVDCGKILGIELLDHLIVNSDDFISLKSEGIL